MNEQEFECLKSHLIKAFTEGNDSATDALLDFAYEICTDVEMEDIITISEADYPQPDFDAPIRLTDGQWILIPMSIIKEAVDKHGWLSSFDAVERMAQITGAVQSDTNRMMSEIKPSPVAQRERVVIRTPQRRTVRTSKQHSYNGYINEADAREYLAQTLRDDGWYVQTRVSVSNGEIDILAEKDNALLFIEVKMGRLTECAQAAGQVKLYAQTNDKARSIIAVLPEMAKSSRLTNLCKGLGVEVWPLPQKGH